jgi:hypothetical protein
MKRVARSTAAIVLGALGLLSACVMGSANPAPHGHTAPDAAPYTGGALPDIGTKMPDGTVYAGLSMDTGKPSFIAAAGVRMPDGTVYAGLSPDTKQRLYTTPADAPGVYTWSEAIEYCKALSGSGHQDWRVPSLGELALQFANRAEIGAFNESGSMDNATGYYWSSLPISDAEAWAQRFNDGFHEHPSKTLNSSVRCVR